MSNAPSSRYSTVAITLHWLIAASIAFQISLGWTLADLKGLAGFSAFQLHKSIGITILLLSLARLAWRLAHKAPPAPAGQPRWERFAAQVVHAGFYIIMIGLPLTGWAIVSASRIEIPTLLWGVIPWPHLPILPHLAAGPKAAVEASVAQAHLVLAFATMGLLALHLGAVFKHQLFDRDAVLGHIAPGARGGRWLEPRLWLPVLGLLVMFVIPKVVFAPQPAASKPATPASVASPPAVATASALEAPVQPNPSPAMTQPAPAPSVAAEPVAPSVWKVSGGELAFAADWSGSPITGQFRKWTADILFDPEALDASKITVSVDVASAATGDAQRDASLPSADWFDAAGHPRAVFTATRIRKVGTDRYSAQGRLQLRGKTQPFTLPFTVKITGDAAKASGSATLDRTAFGVGQGSWAATDQIAGPVIVRFNLTARRAPKG